MSDEETIFASALDIESPQERATFLDRACAGAAELRRRVQSLLEAHARTAGILEAPPIDIGVTETASEQIGSIIGVYKLLEQIGEGGMGVVFMAEQFRPVKRRVALKIIKPGFDTKHVIARFEAERQALAMMDHPGIAKVFDAGATENGRPYFVMELVRGIPITEYCDQNHLAARNRLELFIQVCQAVQHAHQKAIIHRDLKPSNVLVTIGDGDKPIPKVIDFGIAKATGDQRLTDSTLFTEFREMIGTPLYMSPEQAELSQLADIDTRSDVYSLGVLLYELLAGTTPFDKQRLAKAAYDEVRRIIREEDPPRPSTRLSALRETVMTIASQRQSDPKSLNQTLRGELDWIVMKAIEKERGRRYESPSALAQDLDRYLADQPVEACPPSRLYRARKFTRRYRGPLRVAAVVALLLIAATFVSATMAVRARRALDEARRQQQEAERQRSIAKRRFSDVHALAKKMMFDIDDQLAGVGGTTKVRAALVESAVRYLDRLIADASDDPALQAEVADGYFRLAKIQGSEWFASLGDKSAATATFKKGLAIANRLAAADPGNSESQARLAHAYLDAAAVFTLDYVPDAMAIYQKLATKEPGYLYYVAEAQRRMAWRFRDKHDTDQAFDNMRRAKSTWLEYARLNPTAPSVQENLDECDEWIASVSAEQKGNKAEILAVRRSTLERHQHYAQANPNDLHEQSRLAECYFGVGFALSELDRADEALEDLHEAHNIFARLLAADPSDANTRSSLANTCDLIGDLLLSNGDRASAEKCFIEGQLARQNLKSLDPDDPADQLKAAVALRNVGEHLDAKGEHDAALAYQRKRESLAEKAARNAPSTQSASK